MVERSDESKGENENSLEEEPKFSGFLRFSKDKAEHLRAFHYLFRLPGSRNSLRSPFPDDKRVIYQVSYWQFELLEEVFKREKIYYELVEWPKYAKKPSLWPPGMSFLP